MVEEGQLVLFPFPNANQKSGKLRPALILRECPTRYEDWLICMVSSQLVQYTVDIDEIIAEGDADFRASGLKQTSVIRLTRLAVVNQSIFLGTIGNVANERLTRIKQKLANWILA